MARAGGSRPAGGRTGGTHRAPRAGGPRPSPRPGGNTGRAPRTGGVHRPAGSRGPGPGGPSPGSMGGPGWGMGGPGMPPRRHPGPGMPPPPPGRGFRRRRRGGGCLSGLLAVFVLAAIVVCIASIRYNDTTEHHRESAAQIRVTPLPASAVRETAYYTDELGWIRHASALENALEDFYTVTGVQPHIYLSETYRDQSEADSLYSRLFTDEGHFLLVIADDWNAAYILGDDAARVLTDDVMDLFWTNFDDCADSARADEDVLTDAFTYTTDALSPDTSPEPAAVTESERRAASLFMILAVVVFIVVVVVIIAVIVRARKNARHDEASRGSFTRNTDGDTSWHAAPSGDSPSDSEKGDPQPRGYNLNGEFHPYDEDQRL